MSITTSATGLPKGTFTIQAQERIVFGEPAGPAVAAECKRYGAERVLLLSTRSLARLSNGPLQRVVAALGDMCVGQFTEIRAHSPREDVIAGARRAREAGADMLVAVGGGSVIDATKAMQLVLWLGLDSPEAMEPYRASPERTPAASINVPLDPVRMIAVSTTLSAAEFTPHAGVTDARTGTKQTFSHRLQVPRSVILDPEATLDTPDWLLSCTGIRAVDHAVESFCSLAANPASEGLSLQGLRLLAAALPAIKAEPRALRPRLDAQFGMWQAIAASVSGVGTGASHGIGYVLGAGYGVAHGHTSCVMLPAVLQWNAAVNGERQKALAEAMGAPSRPAHELVRSLVRALGQPASLREVGIKREALPDIAERALKYPQVTRQNPRPVRSASDVIEILEIAW